MAENQNIKINDLPKDSSKILSLLYHAKKITKKDLIRTTLVKLLFLLEVEKRARLNYKFIKDHYGPNDKQIIYEANILQSKGLININRYKKMIFYAITRNGELVYLQEAEKEKFKETDRKCREIIRKYGNLSLKELKDHIYKKYCCNEKELLFLKEKNSKELLSLKDIFSSYFKKTYCNSLLEILKMIDYSLYIIRNYNRIDDLIGKNTLLIETSHLIEHLKGEYMQILEKGEAAVDEYFNKDFDLIDRFDYLNDKALQYNLKSLKIKITDITEFMDGESKECLMKQSMAI